MENIFHYNLPIKDQVDNNHLEELIHDPSKRNGKKTKFMQGKWFYCIDTPCVFIKGTQINKHPNDTVLVGFKYYGNEFQGKTKLCDWEKGFLKENDAMRCNATICFRIYHTNSQHNFKVIIYKIIAKEERRG